MSSAMTSPAGRARERTGWLVISLLAVIAAFRVYLCVRPPVETSDLLRNAAYGEAFWRYQFRVYDLVPGELHGEIFHSSDWPTHTYDYPATSLLFYALAVKLFHSVTSLKVALTSLDLVSSLVIARLVRNPWFAVIHFGGPLGVWWVSVEGQTESVIALMTLLCVLALRRNRQLAAFAGLGLAIQTKGLPVLLLPAFITRANFKVRNLLVLAATFIPTAIALTQGSYVARMFRAGYKPTGPHSFRWNPFIDRPDSVPFALTIAEAAYSYILLSVAVLGAVWVGYQAARGRALLRNILDYVPFVLLLVWFKQAAWTQHWYFILAPAFAVLIRQPRVRAALIVLACLEPRACLRLWEFFAG